MIIEVDFPSSDYHVEITDANGTTYSMGFHQAQCACQALELGMQYFNGEYKGAVVTSMKTGFKFNF